MSALVSPSEAAKELNMSLRTLREHIKDGTLPVVVIGRGLKRRHIALDPDDLETFRKDRRTTMGRPCQSTSRRSRRSITTTSSSGVFDIQDLLKERQKLMHGK